MKNEKKKPSKKTIKKLKLGDIAHPELIPVEIRKVAFEKLLKKQIQYFAAKVSQMLVELQLMPNMFVAEAKNNTLGHKFTIGITGEKK